MTKGLFAQPRQSFGVAEVEAVADFRIDKERAQGVKDEERETAEEDS